MEPPWLRSILRHREGERLLDGLYRPWEPEGWPEREVKWLMRRSSWGLGYATEAARACLTIAFLEQRWKRVAQVIHPQDKRSKSVATRLGSTLIGEVVQPDLVKNEVPAEMWGQTADTWGSKCEAPISTREYKPSHRKSVGTLGHAL